MKKFIDGKEYRDIDPNKEIDGHEYVDLGLPSKTLWATHNIGAQTEKELGSFFCWGEITPAKKRYGNKWYNYRFVNGVLSEEEAINSSKQYYARTFHRNQNITESDIRSHADLCRQACAKRAISKYTYNFWGDRGDHIYQLEKVDDAASQIWGGRWHIPNKIDFEELIKFCEWIPATIGDYIGINIFGPNGNMLFIPSEPYIHLWTSTLGDSRHDETLNCYAYQLFATQEEVKIREEERVCTGNIRPICKK